jgi:hypothetical protein
LFGAIDGDDSDAEDARGEMDMGRREDVLCLPLDPVKILLGVYLERGNKIPYCAPSWEVIEFRNGVEKQWRNRLIEPRSLAR